MKRRMPLLVSHTHVMTVLAQHSALAQHLAGAALTQHRLGEGVLHDGQSCGFRLGWADAANMLA